MKSAWSCRRFSPLAALEVVFSIALGIMFLAAGFFKATHLAALHESFAETFPVPLIAGIITLALPPLEMTTGLCLLLKREYFVAVVTSLLLTSIFLAFAIYHLGSDIKSDCPCLPLKHLVFLNNGWGMLFRNLTLLAMSAFLFLRIRAGSEKRSRLASVAHGSAPALAEAIS